MAHQKKLLPYDRLDAKGKSKAERKFYRDQARIAAVQESGGDMGVEWYLSRKRFDDEGTRGERMSERQDQVSRRAERGKAPSGEVYMGGGGSPMTGRSGYRAQYDAKTGKRKRKE